MTFTIHIPTWLWLVGGGFVAGVVVTLVAIRILVANAVGRAFGW